MVYKLEKHGVRTGNSFKRWNTKYYRQYKKHAYLIRSHITDVHQAVDTDDIVQFGKTSAFCEGNSMADGVEYSLNKQRRWDLPGILECMIFGTKNEENYGVQLVERHRIRRLANCISVCSTEGVYKGGDVSTDHKFKIKHSGGYFQSDSVLKRAPVVSKRKRRDRRRRRLQTEDNIEEDEHVTETNKLRYEVHYPSPFTSYQTHNAKCIGMDTYPSFRWSGYRDKRQRCKRRGRMESHIKESLLCMDASFDDSEEEDSVHDADDSEREVCDFIVTLDGILRHASAGNNLTSGKVRHNSNTSSFSSVRDKSSSAKGRVVYLERSETDEQYDTNEVKKTAIPTKRRSTTLQPVRVILADEYINQQTLVQKYGNDFIECECFPRKFVLNISEQVTRLDMFKTYSRSELIHTEACIIFVHDVDNEINNLKETVYKVFLNANFGEKLNSVQIETVFDYMETNVGELIERTLFFMETLPAESIVCENDAYVYKTPPKVSTVEACANWSTESYRPNNAFLLDSFLSRRHLVKESADKRFELVSRFDACTEDGSDNVASPKDRFCCICYTTLEDTNPGTALISCSHWFCDGCWTEYLETQVNNGTLDIQCPEYDCSKMVDPGTFLSLINIRDVIRHANCCHDTRVEQQKSTRWCPNEKCDRVLKRNCEDAKISQCICGIKVCFECLQPPHWPASCESVKTYYKKMRDTGDIAIEPPDLRSVVVVQGKNCPSCNRFIEKNGGCPSMVCVCKANFCWGCGQLWSTRNHGDECYKYGYRVDRYNTERTFSAITPLERKRRQKWYRITLLHRVNQHEDRLQKMKSTIKHMAKGLQHYITKAERRKENVTLDFDVGNKSFIRQTDKTACFLRNTVDLYEEINHVVEHTSILLNSEQMPAGHKLVLKHISHKLASNADVIYELFLGNDTVQANVLLEKLKEVRHQTRKTFQSLIACIRSVNMVSRFTIY